MPQLVEVIRRRVNSRPGGLTALCCFRLGCCLWQWRSSSSSPYTQWQLPSHPTGKTLILRNNPIHFQNSDCKRLGQRSHGEQELDTEGHCLQMEQEHSPSRPVQHGAPSCALLPRLPPLKGQPDPVYNYFEKTACMRLHVYSCSYMLNNVVRTCTAYGSEGLASQMVRGPGSGDIGESVLDSRGHYVQNCSGTLLNHPG
jgi:hypothetical protein